MTFYVSTIPESRTTPDWSGMESRSRLLKDRQVRYTAKETWVVGSGFLPLLMAEKPLDADEKEVLELREATLKEINTSKDPTI